MNCLIAERTLRTAAVPFSNGAGRSLVLQSARLLFAFKTQKCGFRGRAAEKRLTLRLYWSERTQAFSADREQNGLIIPAGSLGGL